MERRPTVGSLIARVGLTGQLLGQIFLTPMAAFGLTYLLVFTAEGGDFRLSIEVDMIPWIGMASLFYDARPGTGTRYGGVHAASCHRGGWLAFGTRPHTASRQFGSPLCSPSTLRCIIPRAAFYARVRPFCSRSCLVDHSWVPYPAGHSVSSPSCYHTALAGVDVPEGLIHQNRQLELALLLYVMCLYVSIRVFPRFARRYITLASLGRKFLGNTLRISWAFPIFLLWSMGQLSTFIVDRALGEDVALNIAFEKQLFESFISAGSTPETSFLNLITALAVMPMAAFTTLAVLGGVRVSHLPGCGPMRVRLPTTRRNNWTSYRRGWIISQQRSHKPRLPKPHQPTPPLLSNRSLSRWPARTDPFPSDATGHRIHG